MKYYTFQPQFHHPIRKLFKVSTIREKEKIQVRERFALRMWTGKPYRSKMGTLGTAVCVEVSRISIHIGMAVPFVIAGYGVKAHAMEDLAEMEGFLCASDMTDYFANALRDKMPFHGVITRWDPSTFEPSTITDPDLGKIGPGHVCKHGIRWPHECDPCADAAWKVKP